MVNIFIKHMKIQLCFSNDQLWLSRDTIVGFNPSFRIQGQIYHLIGSIMPTTGGSPKFCQIYFIDNQESELATRCAIANELRPDIVSRINQLLVDDNHYGEVLK